LLDRRHVWTRYDEVVPAVEPNSVPDPDKGYSLPGTYVFFAAYSPYQDTKIQSLQVWLDQCVLTPGVLLSFTTAPSLILSVGAVIVFFGSMALLEGKPNDIVPRIGAVSHPTHPSFVL
jgi:hypothetical protein